MHSMCSAGYQFPFCFGGIGFGTFITERMINMKLYSLRLWLIKKIAGKDIKVILNTKFRGGIYIEDTGRILVQGNKVVNCGIAK